MSFNKAEIDPSQLGFKSFVSEEELEEKRRVRQEEWEKVRRPDQPLEAPEEEHDNRCLFERLQEQKQKKQDEFEEQFKLRNQVKGLEKDESEFLDYVSKRQQEVDKKRDEETDTVLQEYREAVVSKVIVTSAGSTSSSSSTKPEKKPPLVQGKKSQTALLAGAIKRKRSSETTQEGKIKKQKDEETKAKGSDTIAKTIEIPGVTALSVEVKGQTAHVIGVLPGIGTYTDSEDSDDSSSASEDIDTDIFSSCKTVMVIKVPSQGQ